MSSQRVDFDVRARHVSEYILRIQRRERSTPTPTVVEAAIDRSAAVLFIYNLMESGARGVGEALFEAVEINKLEFDQLSLPLRAELYRLLKKKNPEDAADKIRSIRTDIYGFAYDSKEVFSGNVDQRKWRDRLKDLGCPGRLRQDSARLLVRIKEARNELAHGHADLPYGGTFTIEELTEACSLVIESGHQAFDEVETLIATGGLQRS